MDVLFIGSVLVLLLPWIWLAARIASNAYFRSKLGFHRQMITTFTGSRFKEND